MEDDNVRLSTSILTPDWLKPEGWWLNTILLPHHQPIKGGLHTLQPSLPNFANKNFSLWDWHGGFQHKYILCVLVWLFAIPWTVILQAPPSMGLSRQEYWSGLPCPPPGTCTYWRHINEPLHYVAPTKPPLRSEDNEKPQDSDGPEYEKQSYSHSKIITSHGCRGFPSHLSPSSSEISTHLTGWLFGPISVNPIMWSLLRL